jgi:hypothetical protein
VVGAVLIAGALAYRARRSANAVVSGLVIGLGAALVVTSFIVPGNGDANAPAPATDAIVRVVSPQPGANVPAREPIRVEATVTGGEIADDPLTTEGGHLHVFVDDVLQGIVFSTATEVRLTPGRHTITVEYTDPQHRSYDPPVADSIEVIAAK